MNMASTLAADPDLRVDRSVNRPLQGQVRARTLRLPDHIELTGDTTILAHDVTFASPWITIAAHGHALRLLPIDRVRVDAASSPAAVTSAATIHMDASGQDGEMGKPGVDGLTGNGGTSGVNGTSNPDPSSGSGCTRGTSGGQGGTGGAGLSGQTGTGGTRGSAAGSLTIDIPDGSTDRYELVAHGGRGGAGGQGGRGGQGGVGGPGGTGGDGWCTFFGSNPAGPGGPGGVGGQGGSGSSGGDGGSGGNGGMVTVTHPSGYDSSWISTDVSGGAAGGGGQGGAFGLGGDGGPGGQGGCCDNGGNQADPGPTGPTGFIGSDGPKGSADGSPGTAGTAKVTGRGAVTLTTDKTLYQTGDAPTYTVSGPANAQVLWTTIKNGVTLEQNVFHGDVTDAQGIWTGPGPVWTDGDISDSWIKRVSISDQTAQASFRVVAAPPVQWNGWTAMPGVRIAGQLAWAESLDATRPLVVFGRGADNGLYTNTYTWAGPNQGWYWARWSQMDGGLTSDPVFVRRLGPNAPFLRDELYARGTDGAIYRRIGNVTYWQWQGWQSLGGYSVGKPRSCHRALTRRWCSSGAATTSSTSTS
jgi:hypothetical protein